MAHSQEETGLKFRLIHDLGNLITSGSTALVAIIPVLLITAAAPLPRTAMAGQASFVPLTPGPPVASGTQPRLSVDAERVSTYGLGNEGSSIPALHRYTVQKGDTLQSIAAKLHLQATSLEWANPGLATDVHPGLQLIVPAVDGVLHVVGAGESAAVLAKEFGVDEESLLDFNGLQSPSQLRVGMRLMVPNSKPPAWLGLADGSSIGYRQSDFNHFPWGWCTWYVAERRDIPFSGDAWSWLGSAEALNWPVGMTPRVGAVMVTMESPYYGHVAYVERVNVDGSWVVSEMNYQGFGIVDFRTISPGRVPLLGFIYNP